MILFRLLVIAGLLFATAFAFNWKGPLTLDNASSVAQRTIDQVTHYSRDAYFWALPHLEPVKQQWKQLSRFVAENGRNVLYIVWDKAVQYSHALYQQALVVWPIIQQRMAEAFSLAAHYWRIVWKEAPVYYEALVDKLVQLYQGAQTQTRNGA